MVDSTTTVAVGLDVHARSIRLAAVRADELVEERTLAYDEEAVERLLRRWPSVRCCYEAGPTGFGLYRHLVGRGIDCAVVAPGLVPQRPGDRVKTDPRDARKLARLHAGGLLEAILWVPRTPFGLSPGARSRLCSDTGARRDSVVSAYLSFSSLHARARIPDGVELGKVDRFATPRARPDSTRGCLRNEFVFVQQAAEPVATAEEIELRQLSTWRGLINRRLGERRPLIERTMRPMRVVVQRVFADHVLEVAAAEDQEPVEALAPNGSDPALGMRPRLRRPYRRFDDTDSFRAEDLIEVTRELAVAITDEKPRPDAFVAKLHQQVARLLGHPAAIRVGRDPGQVDAPGRKLDEKST
jgi:hypothetical protein